MIGRQTLHRWLVLPSLVWLALFFVAPLLVMLSFSFRQGITGKLFDSWLFTLEPYQTVFQTPVYWRQLGRSVWTAFLIAVGATTIAYPVAYFLAMRVKARVSLFLFLLILPFWTSYLLRVLAWKIILGSGGAINSLLIALGLIDQAAPLLVYSRTAIIITLTYVWIPFAALPIFAALQRIEPSLLEAATDLGASAASRFLRITLPLSLPGVVAALFMVFIPTIGEYVTPLMVGGPTGSLYGNIIQDYFGRSINWPLGSALAVIMLVMALLLVGLLARLVNLSRFLR